MPAEDSISVIVPALNEEAGLAESLDTILSVVPRTFAEYEVILFDDGSSDRTGEIADELAARHPHVRAVHHPRPMGLGGVIRRGWELARMRRAIWVDGQGVTTPEALESILALRDQADLVVPYACNQEDRSPGRRLIALGFHNLMNVIFRHDVRQYTHLVMCEFALARSLRLRSRSHALQAEALVKMIKTGATYVQVGVADRFEIQGRKSKALRIGNVVGVAAALFWTFWDVAVTRRFRIEAGGGTARGPRRVPEALKGSR